MVVDDFIPIMKNKPVFVYSDDEGEIWPCLTCSHDLKMLETGDGEWWMSFTDFLRCFTHLCICHVQPKVMLNTKMKVPLGEKNPVMEGGYLGSLLEAVVMMASPAS